MPKSLSEQSIQYVKGVGPQRAALLNRLGIKTILDLIFYLPYRYEDRRDIKKIIDLRAAESRRPLFSSRTDVDDARQPQTVIGKVIGLDLKRISGRRKIFELMVSDGSGSLIGKWFNQPFMMKRFKLGSEVVLSGIVRHPYKGRWLEMENPEYEFIADSDEGLIHTGRIVPVYRASGSLSPRQLRGIIYNALKTHAANISDPIPEEIFKRNNLPGLKESIWACHFPEGDVDLVSLNLWQSDYQRRLCFDELFMLEAGMALLKKKRIRDKGIAFTSKAGLISRLRQRLPFRLTPEQEEALSEILQDMKSPYPMNRLLQGDVGSGKTVVALMAMLLAVECRYQAVIMAPTEILAEQHYINIHGMLEDLGLRVCLLTGSKKKRPMDDIASGRIDIVVGTHALIEEGVKFGKLGLIVIDEQHRFGVRQRAEMRKKAGQSPDVLIMTATPIPRTLYMTLYGDLEYSVIDRLPPGRQPVITEVYGPAEKDRIYSAISASQEQKGQVYVVYPVIEGSEKINLKSAILGEEALKKRFPGMKVSLIHGRMKTEEREQAMMDFKNGNTDILVSTTVIEVGVDVPNASLMVIVHAERFGLSQLHQLRGRVGRGPKESRCLMLAYSPMGEEAKKRLDVMLKTSDGFKIAEEDLSIRGPGEVLGTRQSGMPDLRIANIARDACLLETARKEAFSLIEKDSCLQDAPLLRDGIEKFWKGKIELFKTA